VADLKNIFASDLHLTKHEIISGIAVDFHGMSQVQTLHKALTDAFRISSALLIMIGAICSGPFCFRSCKTLV
jgi:hypothetical protein